MEMGRGKRQKILKNSLRQAGRIFFDKKKGGGIK
jgi:hypothetical protein